MKNRHDIGWGDIHRKRLKKKGLKAIIILLVVIFVILFIYVAGAMYFHTHFFPNTKIYGTYVSMMSKESAVNALDKIPDGYVINVYRKGKFKTKITGEDIDLNVLSGKIAEEALAQQNEWEWPVMLGNDNEINIYHVEYNKDKLKQEIEKIDKAGTLEESKTKNASIEYQDGVYYIVPEVYGDSLDIDKSADIVGEAIERFLPDINLELNNCYSSPEYTSDSKEVKDALEIAKNTARSSITYKVKGYQTVYLTQRVIHSWVYIDNGISVMADKNQIRDFVGNLSGMYDKEIDVEKEIDHIISDIKSGEDVTREPEFR